VNFYRNDDVIRYDKSLSDRLLKSSILSEKKNDITINRQARKKSILRLLI